MNEDEILNSIMTDLKFKYDCHTFILYGSRARGDATEKSDFDILGIRNSRNPEVRDARIFQGYYLDAFIYSEEKVGAPDESLLRIHGGKILIEKNGIGTLLLEKVNTLYLAGPKKLALDEIQARRVWAQKMIERASREDLEGNFRRHWLLVALIEDYFLIKGSWYLGPKESFRWLKLNQPQIYDLYEKALKPNSDIKSIIELVKIIEQEKS